MKGISLNITAIVLYAVGGFIISGSNIWIMTSTDFSENIAIAASNLASVFSIGVGAVLTQVDIYNKNKELRSLRFQEPLFDTDII
jgi:hypothetical protein